MDRNWFVAVKEEHAQNMFNKRVLGVKTEEVITA
jgi:hypothetical protein